MHDDHLIEKFDSGEVVFPGKIIRVEHWQVTLPDGSHSMREVACHPGASAVVALDNDGNLILVRQHRIAVDRVTLEIPAGKLDSAEEDPFDCAKRELSEETGLDADHWEKLTTLETTPGFCNERIHIYMATGLHQGTTHPDEGEFVDVLRLPLQTLIDRVMSGEIRDAKTICGIMMAANKASSHK